MQLVNRRDFNLSTDAAELLRRMANESIAQQIKPEMTQSMIEINSSKLSSYDAVLAELSTIRDSLVGHAKEMNVAVAGGGAHPFQKWNEQKIFPGERFDSLQRKYGYLAKQFAVFGQHVHIGCADGDEALYLCHGLARYVPHFIALSAASPFYQSVDTSFDSSRSNVVSAFPLSGTPPLVTEWEEFKAFYDKMQELKIIDSMKDFYWDIRPKPEYGTVEIRVFDTPLTVGKAAMLAGYAQALAGYLLNERPFAPTQDLYLLYSYNRFQAARHGFAGVFVDPETKVSRSIGADIRETARRLSSHARVLGAEAALQQVVEDVSGAGNDAQWIRKTMQDTHSLHDVVRLQSERWAGRPTRH
jgi:carboxylate-amine ligase